MHINVKWQFFFLYSLVFILQKGDIFCVIKCVYYRWIKKVSLILFRRFIKEIEKKKCDREEKRGQEN